MKTILKNFLLGFVIGIIYTMLFVYGAGFISAGYVGVGLLMIITGLIIFVVWWGRIIHAISTF